MELHAKVLDARRIFGWRRVDCFDRTVGVEFVFEVIDQGTGAACMYRVVRKGDDDLTLKIGKLKRLDALNVLVVLVRL